MALQWTLPQTLGRTTASLEERIQGTKISKVFSEFVGVSALFPILDAIRSLAADGWVDYLAEPVHYILFISAFIQAWFLGTARSDTWQVRFFGNLLGFALYVPIDMSIEGLNFFAEPYHWLFGGFSLLIATLSALQAMSETNGLWRLVFTLLLNVSKILLFPTIYLITELHLELPSELTWQVWQDYMVQSGHRFIFYGTLFFGILLGLAEFQRLNYARFLRYLTTKLKNYSEWSLDATLIASAIDNPNALQLRRVEKTILFMDIRGFTAWTEQVDPQQAVDMLSKYYSIAETIIGRQQGHKPTFTADEVMTRFTTPQAALNTALDLQAMLEPLLAPFNLAVGIGLHTGSVIEGLMGSDSTRKYDIIGDAVNTAKRLESAAGRGEIIISATTRRVLSSPQPESLEPRLLRVKGKAEALPVFALQTEPARDTK